MDQPQRVRGEEADSVLGGEAAPEKRVLGDFRILREIGRGGMGVVYEAKQISLDRTVALKVLPFAAVLDERQLKRFQNEARAAATLEHANIVPVYSVGTDRGVYYYAMRLIHGRTIADVITELREPIAGDAEGKEAPAPASEDPDTGVEPPRNPETQSLLDEQPEHAETVRGADAAELTTSRRHHAARFRAVACFGVQVAEALQYAHEQGIIHRDVKPSNLLVDAEANIWVTDFGLARMEGNKDLTGTGELIGTLRYMSPEQVLANRVVVDHRTDVYSLGATLYELLTLRPMHDGEETGEIIHQISFEEPPAPRKLDPHIPRDLETIVLKATSKNAGDRYETAQQMAEDLRRFEEDRPILARPPSVGSRISKWTWRNRRLLTTAVTFLVVVMGLLIAQLWYQKTHAQTVAAKQTRLRETAESNLYRAEMLLAHEEWKEGNIANVLEMLEHHVPRDGTPDLRGWEWYYLKSLCHKDVATLEGHRRSVNWVAFSPDGKRLATASSDTTVRVWDVATRKEILTLIGEDHEAQWVGWSPDGDRIYSWSGGEPVRIWDADSGKSLGFLGDKRVSWAVLSEDGTRILTVHSKNQIVIRDASDGNVLSRWSGDLCGGPIAVSQDIVISGERWPGRAKTFDVGTGKCLLADLRPAVHGIRSIACCPDGSRFVSAAGGGSLIVWNARNGVEMLHIQAHDGAVNRVIWRSDGNRLATASDDGKVKLWNASTGQELGVLRGHSSRVKSVAWNPDGKLLATGDAKGVIKVWNSESNQECILLKGRSTATWSPDGAFLATGGQELGSIDVRSPDKDGRIDIYDTTSWRAVLPPIHDKYFGGTKSSDWSPEGRRLAYTGRGGRVKVWEIPTKRELFSVTAHKGDARGVAWSRDGRWLATVGSDKTVKIWNVAKDTQVACLRGHTEAVGSVAWSPDGRSLASYAYDGEIRIWDTLTWRVLRGFRTGGLKWEPDGECVIAWSPDGDRLASGTSHGWLIVWGHGFGPRGDVHVRARCHRRVYCLESKRPENCHGRRRLHREDMGCRLRRPVDDTTRPRILREMPPMESRRPKIGVGGTRRNQSLGPAEGYGKIIADSDAFPVRERTGSSFRKVL